MDDTRRLIERYYAAFDAGDWSGLLALLDPDVVHDISQGPREHGRAAFAAFLERMARCYAERIVELRILVGADGTHAAAEYVVEGRYLATDAGLPEARGQCYRLPGAAFFAVQGGRITRVSNHYNLRDWLAQIEA
jgi:steroid delta-isomerase-like uncharacterized protein